MLMQKWMAHTPRREERPLALRRLLLLPLLALAIWELLGEQPTYAPNKAISCSISVLNLAC